MSNKNENMVEVIPGLYRSEPEKLNVWSGYSVHGYLLKRDQGNFLVYSSSKMDEYEDFVNSHGGISKQFLSHWDEAGPSCDTTRKMFGSQLICPELDRSVIEDRCKVDATYFGDQNFADDFEVIHTPGHTPGSSCFLWHHKDEKILFTGDNLYPDESDTWSVFISKSEIETTISSLEKMKAIEPDYVIPAGSSGTVSHKKFDSSEWKAVIEETVSRLKAGKTR